MLVLILKIHFTITFMTQNCTNLIEWCRSSSEFVAVMQSEMSIERCQLRIEAALCLILYLKQLNFIAHDIYILIFCIFKIYIDYFMAIQ